MKVQLPAYDSFLLGRENTTLALVLFYANLILMKSNLFEEKYKKLNPKQKEAVDTIEGPVMVVAGPGTGKTTILTLRIANILRLTDTPPSGILALTFTEAGAKAMRAKLREMIGSTALEVPIHTFHGFAASVITEFGEHFPHLRKSKQITDVEAEELLRGILKNKKFNKLRPLGDPDFYISKILGAISDCKQEAWTPEMIEDFARSEIERIKQDPKEISTRGQSKGSLKAESLGKIEKCERTIIFTEVYEAYEARKKDEYKIDFDDLIFELLWAIGRDELLLRSLQEKFLYILLDEHQDTNDTQNLIVRRLSDFFDTPNLFVVGDEKQAIYRFQGASIENFIGFQKTWGQMKIISLIDNYRSHQHILDATFEMIEKNYEENEHKSLRVKLKSSTSVEAVPLDVALAINPETEENYLAERLSNILKKEKDSTVAIIVRRNSEVARILSLLEEAGIPASAERGANIFSHPLGELCFSLLEFLAKPENTEALALTFSLGLWHLDFEKQIKFTKLVRSGNIKKVLEELPEIAKLQEKLATTGAIEFLYLAADISGLTKITVKSPLSVEVWRSIIALSESLAKANEIDSPKTLIETLLSYKKSAEHRVIKIKSGEALSRISIMTAHGSKGLEFDYVFMPFATEEMWIKRNHGSYFILPKEKGVEDDIRDERRLFYVGLTRAKKHVCISLHNENDVGEPTTPLRFIDELDQKLINRIKPEKTKQRRNTKSLDKIKNKQNLEYKEYVESVLFESGLSVTALNNFLECPNKFFYRSILKLPEPPSANSEKGSAMHEALAEVWKNPTRLSGTLPLVRGGKKEKNQNELETAKIIINSVQNYFKKSFLPIYEKEAVLNELITNAPRVARALQEHFSQNGEIAVESWVETYFQHKTDKQNIEIRLHGKLDAVLNQEKRVLIYDYKTREALSPNAIKGETEGGTGDYFRQLVFYKILLEGNSRFKEKTVEPSLVFVKPDKSGRCPTVSLPVEEKDIKEVKSEISNLIDNVWSGQFLSQTCADPNCQYCAYRKF